MKHIPVYLLLVIIAVITSCNQSPKTAENRMAGNWAFLDRFGNYNEAWFGDSVYATYNKIAKRSPDFKYRVRNDSLYSNVDKRKKELNRIAEITWLPDGRFILQTEFVKDTLERITDQEALLGETAPDHVSEAYRLAFNKRYEKFLVTRGIISRQEIEQFRQKQIIPEDVKRELKGDTLN